MGVFKQKATSGGDYAIPPAGAHPAVLVDLGTHEYTYNGKITKNRKVFLVWELTAEPNQGGGNFVVGCDYTLRLNPKAALQAIVEKWRGRALGEGEEFELTALLGTPCLLTLVHKSSQNNRTYAKIDSIGPLPKGMAAPPATLTPFCWEIGDAAELPGWLPFVYGEPAQDVIARSAERTGLGVAPVGAPGNNLEEAF
jgi:hypothetical protein